MPAFLPALRARASITRPMVGSELAPAPLTSTSVSRSSQVPYGLMLGSGQPYKTSWDLGRAVREAYERVVWVYRATHVIADAASRLPICVREGDATTGPMVADNTIERLLNRAPNPWESARSFRYRISSQLVLSKSGVFIEVICDAHGNVVRLMLLPPDRTAPVPDRMRYISSFQVTNSGGGFDYLPPWNAQRPMSNSVIWIKNPNPVDPYMSSTPLDAAGIDVDTHYLSKMYNRSFVAADGRPGGILAVKSQLDPEDMATLKAKFEGGPRTAGRISVLDGADITFLDTATSPHDAQYTQSLDQSKTAILSAFGVPESQAGNTAGRTFDNADADEENFWRYQMLGHMRAIEDGFDQLTPEGWDDNLFVRHDTSGVFVLQREQRTLNQIQFADLNAGAISVDEYRLATGRKPLNVPSTRTLWRPTGLVPVGSDEDVKAVLELEKPIGPPPAPAAQPAAPGGGDSGSQPMSPAQQDGSQAQQKALPVSTSHRARRAQHKVLPQASTGIMVALKPDPQVAASLVEGVDAGTVQPADEVHITLAYLGDIADSQGTADQLLAAVRVAAAAAPPVMSGEISGTTRFNPAPDTGISPFVALVDVPLLTDFRAQLVATVEARDPALAVSRDHGFTPHLTLTYLGADEATPDVQLGGTALTFRSVWVVWGGQWFEVPFAAGGKALPAGRHPLLRAV